MTTNPTLITVGWRCLGTAEHTLGRMIKRRKRHQITVVKGLGDGSGDRCNNFRSPVTLRVKIRCIAISTVEESMMTVQLVDEYKKNII